jgi:hypothetical protein
MPRILNDERLKNLNPEVIKQDSKKLNPKILDDKPDMNLRKCRI